MEGISRVFCSYCSAYFPSGSNCPNCKTPRTKFQVPPRPDQSIWQIELPGTIAANLAVAQIEGQWAVIASWGRMQRDARGVGGGITVLRIADGSTMWTEQVPMPIEGGAVVCPRDGLIVAGMGEGRYTSPGAIAAFEMATGKPRWELPLGGPVQCVPAFDDGKLYVPAGDGVLYCIDIHTSKVVWGVPVLDRATPIPASPILVRELGQVRNIIVGTYADMFERGNGYLAAFDVSGAKLWEEPKPLVGHVRGAPALAGKTLYVTTHRRYRPFTGTLYALDLQSRTLPCQELFVNTAQPGEDRSQGLSPSPLVRDDILYVGSLNHRLYAVDAKWGKVIWSSDVGSGITTTPAWIEDLVVFGTNNGKVHALDPQTREVAWSFQLNHPILTNPLTLDDTILVGSTGGSLVALPWHMGQYGWAAERTERSKDWARAGEYRALAAHFTADQRPREQSYLQAEEDWNRAGHPEWAKELRRALGSPQEAGWDVFISHAWEDNDEIARPLAEALGRHGLRVWYDESTIGLGNRLYESINNGLAKSKHGIVILSPNYFEAEWAKRELGAIATLELDKRIEILPVWHKVTREQVRDHFPMLTDSLAVSTNLGIDHVVEKLLRAIRPSPRDIKDSASEGQKEGGSRAAS